MSHVDIIKSENCNFTNARGDQVNNELFEAVLLSWNAENLAFFRLRLFCIFIYNNLYIFIQKIVLNYTNISGTAVDVLRFC